MAGSVRRLTAAAGLLALFAALPGCASIPDSGQVDEVRNVRPNGQPEPHVRVFAQPPQDTEDPATIVDGFLEALTSDEAGFDTARMYLTSKARETWRPGAGTVIFERQIRSPLQQVDRDSVQLRAEEVARIDSSGLYEPSPRGQVFDVKFQLTEVKGQWRIAFLPQGVYLSRFDFQRLYRPLNVYFFDPAMRVLVPDPVYLPSRRGQLDALVQTVLRGPSTLLGSSVVSAFPPGTKLVGDGVPVDGGVPQIRLSSEVLSASQDAREAMAAQLVQTVAQLGYKEVRITAEGGDFTLGSTPDTRSVAQYQRYDPSAVPSPPLGYFEQNGRLIRLLGEPPAPVPGPFGAGKQRFRSFAVSLTNDQAAAVSTDGRQLWTGETVQGAQGTRRLTGTSLSRPSWDALGRVWVVDRDAAGSTVWVVPHRGNPQRVIAQELDQAQVNTLRISHDGTRVAALIALGGKLTLWVGRVEPRTVELDGGKESRQLTISGMRRIAEPLAEVRDVSWSGPGQLTLLGEDSQGVRLPYVVNFDGSALVPGEGVGKVLASIAAAENQPLLVAADGIVWQLSRNGGLDRLGKGSSPIYPG